ncbi:MAG: hypothetical protein GX601_14760, partial [Anaerolineales bacterium]|nr:hypothetical protein [Anaerolineales bacterium]
SPATASLSALADELASESLPLVTPPVRIQPVEVIQRSPAEDSADNLQSLPHPLPATVQQSQAVEEPERGPNLKELAEQVYPIIRRMLAIERERSPIR